MNEIWKDIYFVENGIEWDYRGLYQVSNKGGRVKSLKYGKEKILKPVKNTKGYEHVFLYKNGKRKTFKIHRLVAFMFIEGYFEGAEIDHIDTNRTNNHVSNLRWCTSKENSNNELSRKHYSEAKKGENHYIYGKHRADETRKKMSEAKKGENNPMYGKHHSEETRAKQSETMKGKNKGKNNPQATLVDRFDKQGNYIDTKYQFEYVQLGFNKSGISSCCKGRHKTHKGFIFKYHEDKEED